MTPDTLRPGITDPLQGEGLCELAAALAHEIKNPAALALAHVTHLRKREDLRGIGDACDHIEDALEHICCLVQEMLLVTYGAAPAYDFDLEDMLTDMLEVYQAAWPNIKLSLHVDPACEGFMYYGEETYAKMIFSNLLKNAVEAVRPVGAVHIELAIADGDVVVTIADSGGPSPVIKPHASGLGLAICRWLCGRMRGRVEVGTIAAGGCMATVVLPL